MSSRNVGEDNSHFLISSRTREIFAEWVRMKRKVIWAEIRIPLDPKLTFLTVVENNWRTASFFSLTAVFKLSFVATDWPNLSAQAYRFISGVMSRSDDTNSYHGGSDKHIGKLFASRVEPVEHFLYHRAKMNYSCLSNHTSNEDFSYLVNKNIQGDKDSEDKSYSKRGFYEGIRGADLPAENNHEPLEASHGARIMDSEVGVSHLLRFIIITFVAFHYSSIHFVQENYREEHSGKTP